MGIHRFQPTPEQERRGRIALGAIGALVALVGAGLGWFCVRMVLGAAELGADAPVRFGWPLLVVAAFMMLVGLSLTGLAFVPGRDASRGPPRGFAVLTRVFDGFWAVVREATRRL